jgi:DNA-binding beta-propeller fold protein YncE
MRPILWSFLAAVSLAGAPAQTAAPDLGYKPVLNWPELPAGRNFGETSGIALDSRGHVYVLNRSEHQLLEFDAGGKLLRTLVQGMFTRTHGLRIDHEDNLWATDDGGHLVFKMNRDGRVLMVLGRRGRTASDEHSFNRPTDVAVAPNGDFYVADGYGNSRVVKFSKEGKFLLDWGKKGSGPGEFNLVHSVALDGRGRVYVGDRENRRMQIFDESGKFLNQWTHVGSPWAVTVTPDQRIFIADGYANQVLVTNLEGQVLGRIGSSGRLTGQFNYVHGLAVSPGGDVYTAEILNWRPQKFVRP